MADEATVFLRSGKERPILNRHPWIFSGAIERVSGSPADGDTVLVADASRSLLARGYINTCSQICVRILSWDLEEAIDAAFWRRRLERALAGRRLLGLGLQDDTTAYRLVNAESDGLPGLIVDRYGPHLAVQFLTLGMDCRREAVLDALEDVISPAGIYERDDVNVRRKEGLEERVGVLRGAAPPDELEILEAGRRFLVDVKRGQKTGFYLDQRDNRARVAAYAAGREVLNGFCFTGSFGVYAAGAGATSLINLDVSPEVLGLCARHLELNGVGHVPAENRAGDVFVELRRYRSSGRRFDMIILDPPKFAPTGSQVMAATRGYKDINLLAMGLLRPDGILATFSCSGQVTSDLFQKVIFGASIDAGRPVQILESLTQAGDHPVLLSFPESAYLKGLICRVL